MEVEARELERRDLRRRLARVLLARTANRLDEASQELRRAIQLLEQPDTQDYADYAGEALRDLERIRERVSLLAKWL